MISCEIHDYIEIVCTYKYPLKLLLKSGDIVEGVGLDTGYDENRKECIKFKTDQAVHLLSLDTISVLEVCVDNPHVRTIAFDK